MKRSDAIFGRVGGWPIIGGIFRRRYSVVLISLAFLVGAAVRAYRTEYAYVVTSTLNVKSLVDEVETGEVVTAVTSGTSDMTTLIEQVRSDAIVSESLAALDVAMMPTLAQQTDPVEAIKSALVVRANSGDRTISLVMTGRYPTDLRQMLDAVEDVVVARFERQSDEDRANLDRARLIVDGVEKVSAAQRGLAIAEEEVVAAKALLSTNGNRAEKVAKLLRTGGHKPEMIDEKSRLVIATAETQMNEAEARLTAARHVVETAGADSARMIESTTTRPAAFFDNGDVVDNQVAAARETVKRLGPGWTIARSGVPHAPAERVGPSRRAVCAQATGFGLGFGLVVAMVLELLAPGFHSPAQVRKTTGLRVLGVIPALPGDWSPFARALVSHIQPSSFASDACGELVKTLWGKNAGAATGVILFTSGSVREGRSTVATNFAATLARLGNRVLLVDANPNDAVLRKIMATIAEPARSGGVDARSAVPGVVQTHVPGLSLLSPSLAENRTDVSEDGVSAATINRLREHFACIVIDAPPVAAEAPVPAFVVACDAVLMVVHTEYSRPRRVASACAVLELAGATVVGTVINALPIDDRWFSFTDAPRPRSKYAVVAPSSTANLIGSRPRVQTLQ